MTELELDLRIQKGVWGKGIEKERIESGKRTVLEREHCRGENGRGLEKEGSWTETRIMSMQLTRVSRVQNRNTASAGAVAMATFGLFQYRLSSQLEGLPASAA